MTQFSGLISKNQKRVNVVLKPKIFQIRATKFKNAQSENVGLEVGLTS